MSGLSNKSEVRVDALEDAVYEKALTSAASDATARRKIEGIFSRLVGASSVINGGGGGGSGNGGNNGKAPPLNLPIRTFKRGLLVYLNGVEDEDLTALARRYLARGGKTVSVGRFLDGVFHVPPDDEDDLLDPKHEEDEQESNGNCGLVEQQQRQQRQQQQQQRGTGRGEEEQATGGGGIVADPHFWVSGGVAQPAGGGGDNESLQDSEQRGHFQKRLARFLLGFRRAVLRKAQEASQSLPAHRRLQTHQGELAEKVSRRLLLEGFQELSAIDAQKQRQQRAANESGGAGGATASSSSSSSSFSSSSLVGGRRGAGRGGQQKKKDRKNPSLSREGFLRLVQAFRGEGFDAMDDADTDMLWSYIGEGSYHAFASLVFAPEVHEERVAGQGRHGRGIGAHDVHAHHTVGTSVNNHAQAEHRNPTAELGFERGLIEGSRRAPEAAPMQGPFDRQRSGERQVVPPPRAKIPKSIKYPQSRTTVSPPSDFEPALVTRSGKAPRGGLELEHVFGFNGQVATPALHAAADGTLVFPVACVVVVHDSESGQQRLFQGHDDDVTAVAVSDSGCEAASGQTGKVPFVLVWDPKTLSVRHKLGVGFFQECVFALAFSGDAGYLVTVGDSEQPYIGVWDTASGQLMAEMSAAGGKTPPIWQVLCHPRSQATHLFEQHGHDQQASHEKNAGRFVTVGNNSHVTFYSFDREAVPAKYGGGGKSGVPLRRKVGTLENKSSKQDGGALVMHSVAFLGDRDNLVASGGSDGRVYLWRHGEPVGSFRADEGAICSMQAMPGSLYTGSSVGLVRKFETEAFTIAKTLTADDGLRRQVEEHATEVHDAFGMAQAQRGMLQVMGGKQSSQTRRGGDSSANGGGNSVSASASRLLKSFDGDMKGVLGSGWRERERQKRQREMRRPGMELESVQGGGSSNRPAGVASHPALRKISRMEACARFGARHLRVVGQPGHRTVFVGTKLGEVYAIREDLEANSHLQSCHEHLACHIKDLSPGTRCVVTCHSGSVSALAPHPTARHAFYTVGADRWLLAWNMRSRACATAKRLPACPTCLDVSGPRLGAIAVGFSHPSTGKGAHAFGGGEVRVYLVETMAEIATLNQSAEAISCVKFSPNCLFLAAGNRANVVDLYSVNRGYRPHKRLRGHTSFVECLDWSLDSKWLQSTCGSYEILYWDAVQGRQILDTDTVETDTEWAGWTCKLGFPVMGIWGKNQCGNDINAVSRSPSGQLLATANDTGEVCLFNYPCVAAHAPAIRRRAHGAHVTGVSFLADSDEHLASAGGVDKAIMFWKVVAPPEQPSRRGAHRQTKQVARHMAGHSYDAGGANSSGSGSSAMIRETGTSTSLSAGSLNSRLRSVGRDGGGR